MEEKYEVILRVGRRGEIYTTAEVRKLAGIKEGGRVRAVVEAGKLVLEPLPSLEDLIGNPLVEVSAEEVERISEEAQREAGAYG